MSSKPHTGLWVAYWLSLFTPITCLLSGVIAIIYAGYRLDKDEDGELANSHYYALIRSFFLNLTFFVVLAVTVATSNGLLKGVHRYWYQASWLDTLANMIPYVGMTIAVAAIIAWFIRIKHGMQKLKHQQHMVLSKHPSL